jgi:hypothetical protein
VANYYWYGYFSETAAKKFGSSYYRRHDGKTIEVTFVCRDILDSEQYKWPDKVYVGLIEDKWLGKAREGTDEHLYSYPKMSFASW